VLAWDVLEGFDRRKPSPSKRNFWSIFIRFLRLIILITTN